MMSEIENVLLSGLIVASGSILWRQYRLDTDIVQRKFGSWPAVLRKSLECASCFTYWLSLVFVLLFDPLSGWDLIRRFERGAAVVAFEQVFLSWMAVGGLALLLVFSYLSLQGVVNGYIRCSHSTDE